MACLLAWSVTSPKELVSICIIVFFFVSMYSSLHVPHGMTSGRIRTLYAGGLLCVELIAELTKVAWKKG